MKTHLPVALRKALIAALVAVSVSEYNQAQAAMNLHMDAAAVSNVCEVNTLDVELTGSLAGGNHQITSTTGNLDINTDSDLDGDYEIEGVGNSFKTESGYIKAGSVEGNETRFETVSGDIITGDIISDGNSFKTESGFIETGDITGNNTTLEVTGEGAISTGEITGSGTRIQAEHSTLENISNMEGVTMTVGGIEATAADTNATLKATEITSTGNVTIGADDAGAEETDTLTLTENSSITATGTDDGAGNVTHATMKIDQNVALAGGSFLSTTGGDVTVTGHVAVSNAGTISSDKASVSIGSLGDASDNLKISAGKDVAIGEIANTPEAPPMKSYTDAVADLQVTAGGAVQIGDSAGSLLDASIEAQGAITIGQTAASSMLLEVHDSTTGNSLISTQDDLTVNQSIRIDSTGGDRVYIKAAGGMLFKGENTHMHGDSASVIDVESVESIVFSSLQGTDIGTGVIVKTTGEDSDISVHSGDVSVNPVAGKMYALKGAVRIDGGTNQIMSDVDTPTLQAQDGIEVTARKENTLDNALLQTVAGGIELESDRASGINMVYDSALSVTREGNITISGHENYLKTATGETVDGKIMLTAGALNKIDVRTRLEATQEVEIAAGTNNLIRGATVVKSKQAGIDITAATGGNQITGAGTKVAASGAVTIGAATNNLIEAGATVLSDTDNIGISADGGNQITGTDTRVEAEQAVKIEAGTNNLIGAAAVVKSKQAGIDMTAATGGNQITGAGTKVAASGAVTIGAAANNFVDAGAAVLSDTDNVIISAAGGNFVQNAATVNAGGTGYIYLNGGTTATNVVRHAGTELTAGGNVDMSGAQNIISDSAKLDSGKNVNLVAAERNYVDKATILADGMIGALGVTNVVNQESQVRATAGITIHSTGSSADDGNLITGGSSVVSETDKVHILAGMSNEISGTDTRVEAAREVKIEAGANNLISDAAVVKSKQAGIDMTSATGGNQITGAGTKVAASGAVAIGAATDNLVDAGATVLSDTENISISADGGNQISGTDTRVEAEQAVTIEAGTNNLISDAAVVKSKQAGIDMTAETGGNQIAGAGTKVAASGQVTISAATNNTVSDGACVRAENAGVGITGEAVNTVDGSEVKAQGGALTMGNENLTTDTVENRIRNAAVVTASENVELTGDANAISGASSVEAGLHVTMTADTQNAVVDSTVTAKAGNITLSDVGSSVASLQNVVTSSAGETTTLTAGGNVTIAGENIITGTDPGATRITAEKGSISIHDDNYIRNVALEAQGAEGDVSVITGAGKATWIEDSSISGETVLIAGDVADGRSDDKLAVVTGDAMEIISRGEDDGAGITLNNVSVQDTVRNEQNIMAKNDGNIILRNRVDLENGTLSIENAGTSTGRISVDGDTVLNMKAASTLNGRLTGAGIINKSGGDELLLNYDHTSFNGTIYANGSHSGNPADGSVADSANPGSWITISGAGVGSGASIVLKNTDLVITAPGAQIGTLDTTWDEAGVNNEHLTGGTLISDGSSSDGSYTKDGNSRADFTTVGSVLEVNKAATGDVVAASDMNLSDATLIKLNAAIAEDGSASSDVIHASGTINAAARTGLNSTSTATAPSTARVYVMHNDAAATAAEGARTTIMQGTMATDINEDVLYDVAESGNGTYQRILQERNVHLENGGNHVDLVYSKNYRSASKTPQMQQVANALREISDTFHHSEGTLAASPNRLHNLIDAFDYTRSEGAAQRGLQSVAGTGNVLPRLMMFDSSRRHLENLRGQMLMPVCADTNGMGGVVRRNNVWMTYTSSHDELCGDAYLEDYSRSANGAMLGIDRSVNCKLRVGLSLGYEESTGKSGSSRIEADTFFVDAYAAGVTGRFKHRASVGLATSGFDTNRNVLVEAGYHTFVGTGKGSVDSLSLNFGYEISTDYKLSETATLTPYAALNLSWHKLDTMREQGMGEAGLVTAYDNEWQSEIILGVSYNRLFTVLRNQAPALFYADAAMHLELFNDRVSVKNRFLGASGSWRAESMNRQPLYFELGVGVAVPLSPGWTATAGAAYEIGPDRAGVSGNVGVRYSF